MAVQMCAVGEAEKDCATRQFILTSLKPISVESCIEGFKQLKQVHETAAEEKIKLKLFKCDDQQSVVVLSQELDAMLKKGINNGEKH